MYITRKEAEEALKRGERVLFHYNNRSVEVTLNTTFQELLWELLDITLTISDIANGKYSIIRQHKLKIWPKYFQAVANGIKTFEIRKNDRGFRIGDRLILQEYDPETKTYSGREIKKKVVYITDFEQKENYVVMAIV